MIVIAGKKEVRRKLGWVGEFCPVCRALECWHVTRVSQASHVYYVSLGKGRVVAHEMTCRGCGTLFGVETVPYVTYSKRPSPDVVELIEATNAESVERHSERMDLEDRIAAGSLTAEERVALIAEPIMALNYLASKKVGKGMIPTEAGVCIIFLVFLVPVAIITWLTSGAPLEARLILSGIVALLLAGTWLGFKHGGRGFVRGQLHPRLGRALAPLRPTHEELDAVLGHMSRQGYIIAKRLRAAELHEAIERARVTVPAL